MAEFEHEPVLRDEVLEALCLRAGGRYIDATVGGAGHALGIMERTRPDGWLFGCDRDVEALAAARERLSEYAGCYQLREGNFADLAVWVESASCDGVLMDLGVSSHQLDSARRGFSFQADGPLDMRMSVRQGFTAADVVNTWSSADLETVFRELGEEPGARRLARSIERERVKVRFETTRQLAALVERVCPRGGRRQHPATRLFQALRMVVNDELGSLRNGLAAALNVLRPGGRLAVITFHSVEDRVVKRFGTDLARDYVVPEGVDIPELRRPVRPRLRWVTRKAIQPGAGEVARNVRSRSARLRVMERTADGSAKN